jgi:tRNA(fMet)-specific endonuclease VapC
VIFILDTDTLSHLYHGQRRVTYHVQQHASDQIVISIITKIEVLRSRYEFLIKADSNEDFARAQERLQHTEEFLADLLVLPLTPTITQLFQSLRRQRGLKKIGRADLLIASTALALDASVVTRNLRHFHLVPRLKVENWVDD